MADFGAAHPGQEVVSQEWIDDLHTMLVALASHDRAREYLSGKGLTEEEAFLIAARRIGNLPSLSKEFRKLSTHDLWKSLFSEPADIEERRSQTRDVTLVIILAVCAALLTEVPKLFGIGFEEHDLFYLRNASFFVLPFITIFFIKKRMIPRQVQGA